MKSFFKRLATSVVVLLLLILIIYDMNHIYRFGMFLCASIASYEVLHMMADTRKIFSYALAILLNILVYINTYTHTFPNEYIFMMMSIIFSIISVVDAKFSSRTFVSLIFTTYFIIFPFSIFYKFTDRDKLILIFLIAISSDVFAYVFGSLFGKHKLIERISPNKTIEGSVGSYIITVAITYFYTRYFNLNLNPYYYIGLILAPVVAQFGDLIFSKLKRYYNIKDYGYIFPGHGGIMDRFDSVLLVCPFVLICFF